MSKASEFSPAVTAEVKTLQYSDALFRNRRPVKGITVDSSTSRDLDDAVWLERRKSGVVVSISIADVSSLVKPGSYTDREAYFRVFTRYYAQGTEPMIPAELSEDRLSLLPKEKRPTITVSIPISSQGSAGSPTIEQTYLESIRRYSYEEADKAARNPTSDLDRMLTDMNSLAQTLLRKRRDNGALAYYDFRQLMTSTEEGGIRPMTKDQTYHSHVLIQELMILTNTVVAEFAQENNTPILFRNHQASPLAPEREDIISQLSDFMTNPEAYDPGVISKRLGMILQRGNYGSVILGHYGLNQAVYTHFSSPIRRYPDLVNHRVISALISGEASPYPQDQLREIASHINSTENEAKDAKDRELRTQRYGHSIRAMEAGSFYHLNDMNLHRALNLAVEAGELPPNLEVNLGIRIENDRLAPRDVYKILIESPIDAQEWINLKGVSVDWLRKNPSNGGGFLLIAHQRLGWSEPQYETRTQASEGNRVFSTAASVTIGDETHTSKECSGRSIKEAQQKAACDLITRIINIKVDDSRDMPDSLSRQVKEPIANYKGQLQERVAANNASVPNYKIESSGPPHAPIFKATVSVIIRGSTYISVPVTAGSKAEAEKLAAAALINQFGDLLPDAKEKKAREPKIPEYTTTSAIKGPNTIDTVGLVPVPKNEYVAALNLYFTDKGLEAPAFGFTSEGPPHAPTFNCTYTYTSEGGESFKVSGIGGNKATARLQAAAHLYTYLATKDSAEKK